MGSLLLQLGILLTVAIVAGRVARFLKQPAVIGEIIGGLLCGPTVLGHVWPNLYQSLFAVAGHASTAREIVVGLGMVFFLFTAGLEVRLDDVRGRWAGVLTTGMLGSLLPFALGLGAAFILPTCIPGVPVLPKVSAFVLAIGLSISALPVIVRILLDLNLLQTRMGTVALVGAAIGDLLGWTAFAGVLSWHRDPSASLSWMAVRVLGCTAGLVFFGRFVAPWLLAKAQRLGGDAVGYLGMLCAMILLAAAGAEAAGIHAVFGAFVLGVSLGHARNRTGEIAPLHEGLQQFSLSFFAPLYFVSVGLRLDFGAHFDILLVLGITVLACVGKVVGAGLGARLAAGLPWREAMEVGVAMNARGAMEIVLATVALDAGLIAENMFVALVMMALLTSLVSAPLLQFLQVQRGKSLA